MQTAPELIFHDVERSAWLENYILERVQRLDRFADEYSPGRGEVVERR